MVFDGFCSCVRAMVDRNCDAQRARLVLSQFTPSPILTCVRDFFALEEELIIWYVRLEGGCGCCIGLCAAVEYYRWLFITVVGQVVLATP